MIKKLLVLLALLSVLPFAFATDYAPAQAWNITGHSYPTYASPDAACAAVTLSPTGVTSTSLGTTAPTGYYQCIYHYSNGSSAPANFDNPVINCSQYGGTLTLSPAGALFGHVGTSYMCTGGNPPAQCSAHAGPVIDVTTGWLTGPDPGSAQVSRPFPFKDFYNQQWCYQGCLIQADASATSGGHMYVSQVADARGYFREFASQQQTLTVGGSGLSCQGKSDGDTSAAAKEPVAAATPAPLDKCPVGSVPSGQDSDGTTICVGKPVQPATSSQQSTTTPSTTTTDASGNTVVTSSTTNTNGDGSHTTVTTTTTTAPDGTKTTSTSSNTTAAASGAPGTTDKPDAQKDMCALHPELTICRNSQVTGSCALITCDGDAIQCATLRAAATMQCAQQKDQDALAASPLTAAGQAGVAGTDRAGLPSPTASTSMTVQAPDQSGWLSGGAFFADKTVTFRGQTIVLPFSKAADYVVAMRYALMVVAAFVSFRILAGAIKG